LRNHIKVPTPLETAREELLLIQEKTEDPVVKGRAAIALALSFDPPKNPDEMKKLFSAYGQANVIFKWVVIGMYNPMEEEHQGNFSDHPELLRQYQHLQEKLLLFTPIFKDFIEKNPNLAKELLQERIRLAGSDEKIDELSGTFPLYSFSQGKSSIDLIYDSCRLSSGQPTASPVPHLFRGGYFFHFFRGVVPALRLIEKDVFAFSFQGSKYKIIFKDCFILYREIEGEWYTPEDASNLKIPSSLIRNKDERFVWVAENLEKCPHIYSFEPDRWRIDLKVEKDKKTYEIVKVAKKQGNKELHLVSYFQGDKLLPQFEKTPVETLFSLFSKRAHSHPNLWANSSGDIEELEMSHPFPLHFRVREKKIFLEEVPGFFLSEAQPSFEQVENFLLLEDGKGNKKALSFAESFSRGYREDEPFIPQPIVHFAQSAKLFDLSKTQTLEMKTLEDKCFMASLLFASGETAKAHTLLQKLFSELSPPLRDEEKHALTILSESFLPEGTLPTKPDDLALMLYVAATILQLSSHVRISPHPVQECYTRYLQSLRHVRKDFRLNTFQELLLCNFDKESSKPSSFIAERKSRLLSKEKKEARVTFPPLGIETRWHYFMHDFVEHYKNHPEDLQPHDPRDEPLLSKSYSTEEGIRKHFAFLYSLARSSKTKDRERLLDELYFVDPASSAYIFFSNIVFSDLDLPPLEKPEDFKEIIKIADKYCNPKGLPFPQAPKDQPIQQKQKELEERHKTALEILPKEIKIPELNKKYEELHKQRDLLGEEIVTLASYTPKKVTVKEEEELYGYLNELRGGTHPPFTWESIASLFIRNDKEEWQRANPYLDEMRLKELYNKTIEFLFISTEAEHLKRIESDLSQKERLRAYSAEDPHALFFSLFELQAGIRLNPNQVASIEALISKKDEILLQLIMGAGKSSVMTPVLSEMLADGNTLVCSIVPKALYHEALSYLRKRSYQTFRQKVEFLEFDPKKDVQEKRLTEILTLLETVIKKRECIVTRPETIQDFELALEQQMEQLDKDPKAQENITLLEKILTLFHNQGCAILDEPHLTLDRKNRRKFALGDFKTLSTDRFGLMEKIFKILNSDPALGIRQNKQSFHTLEQYLKIKSQLLDTLIAEYLPLATEDQKKEVKLFLSNKDKEPPKWLEEHQDQTLKDQLGALRGQVLVILPLTLKMSANERFGYSNVDLASEVAIPYAASGQPVEGSEFSNPYETADYTFLLLLSNRLSDDKVAKWIQDMKKEAELELVRLREHNPRALMRDTATFRAFKAMVPKWCEKHPDLTIGDVSRDDIGDLAKEINTQDGTIFEYAKRYVFSQIGYYESEISADPCTLIDQFHRVMGFSGTLSDGCQSYHDRLKIRTTKGTDEETIRYVQDPEKATKVKSFSLPQGGKAIVKELIDTCKLRDYNALIDVGAICKGIPNEVIAREILENTTAFDAICFFGPGDQKFLLFKGKKEPVLFSEFTQPQDKTKIFTFFDQPHCTGFDIPQHDTASGLVTLGTTPLSHLLQGVGRMRKLKLKQRVDIAVPEELFDKIKKEGKCTASEVIEYSKGIQAKKELDDNFLAFEMKLDSHLKGAVMEELLDPKLSDDEKKEIWKDTRKLFVHTHKDSPWEQYASPDVIQDPIEVLQQAIKMRQELYKDTISKRLKKALQFEGIVLPKGKNLPEKVFQKKDERLDTQQEVQAEKKTQTQTQTQVETQASTKDTRKWTMKDLESLNWKEIEKNIVPLSSRAPECSIISKEIAYTDSFSACTEEQMKAFDKPQPTADFVYISRDERGFHLVCLHQKDAASCKKYLLEMKDNPQKKEKMCLYNMWTGQVYQNPKGGLHQLSDKDIQNEELQELLVQVKIFNGQFDFNEKELASLKRWIEKTKQDPTAINTLSERVCDRHRNMRAEYDISPVASFLKKIPK
jgi:hypothetical protein